MSLEACKECGTEISTRAKSCPKCGWKRPNYFLRGILGAIGFVIAGIAINYAATPKYQIDAIQQRNACEKIAGGVSHLMHECESAYSRAMWAHQEARRPPPPPPKVPPGCRLEAFSWGEQVVCP